MSCFNLSNIRSALPIPCAASRAVCAPTVATFTGLHSTSRLPSRLGRCVVDSLTYAPQNGSTVFMSRHGRRVPKLGRPADQRRALIRNLTTEVIRHGKITTTETKAKAIRKYVDKMIQLAKRGDLHARRQAAAFMFDKKLVTALFEGAGARFADRDGGYCKVTKEWYTRRGDGVEMATIELVD